MSWWRFGRGGDGRHALGAAVTSLPSGPLVVPVPVLVPVLAPVPDAVLQVVSAAEVEAEVDALEVDAVELAAAELASPEFAVPVPLLQAAPPPEAELFHESEAWAEPTVEPVLDLTWSVATEALEEWGAEPVSEPVSEPVLEPALEPVFALEPAAVTAPAAQPPVEDLDLPVVHVEDVPSLPTAVPAVVDELARLLAAADPAALDLDALLGMLRAPLPTTSPEQPVVWTDVPAEAVLVPQPVVPQPVVAQPFVPAPFVPAPAVPFVPQQGRVQLGFRDGSTASLAPDSDSAVALGELARLLTASD